MSILNNLNEQWFPSVTQGRSHLVVSGVGVFMLFKLSIML